MDITINIPPNAYKQPTEVRPHVVQAICEAFLAKIQGRVPCSAIYHPRHDGDGRCRTATSYVTLADGKGVAFADHSKLKNYCGEPVPYLTFHGCEMQAAFHALRKAGYHMLRVLEYGTWGGFMCHDKPFLDRSIFDREVTDFTIRID